jgi:hypothetical protein
MSHIVDVERIHTLCYQFLYYVLFLTAVSSILLLIQIHGHCGDEGRGRGNSWEEIVRKQGAQKEVNLARQKIMKKSAI